MIIQWVLSFTLSYCFFFLECLDGQQVKVRTPSRAALTHRLKKIKSKMLKCKQCDNYIYVNGVECEEVGVPLASAKSLERRRRWWWFYSFLPPSVRPGFAQEVHGGVSDGVRHQQGQGVWRSPVFADAPHAGRHPICGATLHRRDRKSRALLAGIVFLFFFTI